MACLLSGDVFSRYYKLRGYETVYVSGSDAHGTRIEFEALRQNISPKQLSERVHGKIVDIIEKFGIEFENYTTTESPTHKRFVSEIYKKIEANGHIFAKDEERAYCQADGRFLADSFIVGTCPHCGFGDAFGNQCDNCGALLEPEELIKPRCQICNQSQIIFKKTRNWYLDLKKLEPRLKEYAASRAWAPNVKHLTEGLLKEGLRPRAVTRDISWGIPAPFSGAEGKVIYVWAEAALGYVSATMEYFEKLGAEERWRDFWFGDDVKQVYTQAKDNIPFHTIFFPGQLIASGENYHLPDQIPAVEYLNWIGGQKFSKSRQIGLFGDDALQLLDGIYWRFYLLYFRPERRDIDFSWEDLDKALNGVLINNISNLINRLVSLANTRYEGVWPQINVYPLIFKEIKQAKEEVERTIEDGYLAPALRKIADLAVIGNEYVQRNRPWEGHKPEVIATALQLIQAIAIMLEPFVPNFSKRAYKILGLGEAPSWDDILRPGAGRKLGKAEVLLQKVDIKALQDRYAQMKAG